MDLQSLLELLFSSVIPLTKSDSVVLLIHAKVLQHNFKSDVNGEPSVLLPETWNTGETYEVSYYTINGDSLILKGIKTEEELFVNLQLKSGGKTSDSACGFLLDVVTEDFKQPSRAFLDFSLVSSQIDRELIEPLFKKPEATPLSTQRAERGKSPSKDPLRVPSRRPEVRESDPWAYGRGDLDPLGRAGGGTLMDPFHHGRRDYEGSHGLPRGAVPPGARFDPVGPMGPDLINPPLAMPRPRQPPHGIGIPDPDHMMPPGFGDDFM